MSLPPLQTSSSNDGDNSETESSYTEIQGELLQINESIESHRAAMREHRTVMMSQIEGILAHLKRKDHPIHAAE